MPRFEVHERADNVETVSGSNGDDNVPHSLVRFNQAIRESLSV